jgi:hypothetical protein
MPTDFGLYCPLIICSVTPVFGATADRTIRIDMIKADDAEIKKKLMRDQKHKKWKYLRDDVVRFWIKHYKYVWDKYVDYIDGKAEIDGGKITNRLQDIWGALLTMAMLLDECNGNKAKKTTYHDDIVNYINSIVVEMKVDTMVNDYGYILLKILEQFKEKQKISCDSLFDEFTDAIRGLDLKRVVSKRLIGTLMRKFGYTALDGSKRHESDGIYYVNSKSKNDDYLRRYFYKDLTDDMEKEVKDRADEKLHDKTVISKQ